MTAERRILIDTDLKGLNDDAFALHYLLQLGTPVDHLSTVFGNTSAAVSAADAVELRDLYPAARFPVSRGRETPLRWAQEQDSYRRRVSELPAETYLAAFGLDQPLLVEPPPLAADGQSNPSMTLAIPRQPPGSSVDLIALGPLTNVAAALSAGAFDESADLRVLVCAGGLARGNVTRHAEFNAFADPYALDVVLSSTHATLTLVPLEVTEIFVYDHDQYARIAAGGTAFGNRLGPAKGELFAGRPGLRDQAWDLAAALLWLDPGLATDGFHAPVVVEQVGGPDPGRTRRGPADCGRPDVHVVTAIDHDRARERFTEAFA